MFAILFSFPFEAKAALSRTPLYSGTIMEDVNVPISVTSSSFTPPDNSLLVVITGIQNFGTHGTVSVSGGGLTWTNRVDTGVQYLSAPPYYYSVLQIWTAPVTTAAAMAVTVASTDTSFLSDPSRVVIQTIAYTGYDTSNPTGVATTSQNMGDAAKTITFTSSPTVTSEVIAARYRQDNGTVSSTATPGSGWNEVYDEATSGGYGDIELMARAGSTSQNITWDDLSDNAAASSWSTWGAALEINAAIGRVIRLRGGVRLLGGVRLF